MLGILMFVPSLLVGCSRDESTAISQADPSRPSEPAPPGTAEPGRSPLPATPTKAGPFAIVLTHAERRWTLAGEDLGAREGKPGEAAAEVLDEARLTACLESLARDVDRPAVDARLALRPDLTEELTPSRPGVELDVGASASRVRETVEASLRSRARSEPLEVALAVREVLPATTEADLADARQALRQALSGPITLRQGDRSWDLAPQDLAPALRVVPGEKAGAKWQVRVEEEPLRKLVERLAPQIDQPAVEARFAWNGGQLKVIRESQNGRRLDAVQTARRVMDVLLTSNRTVGLVVVDVPPAVDAPREDQLGIGALIESASTSFAGSIPEKQANIKLAASRLNGVVVPPGATFSFNRAVGPTTLSAGFQWAYGVVNGSDGMKTVPSVAGGICQVSTTLFQAVFWAGYQIERRSSHLYWIPAYASRGVVGLDSTVDEASGLDFRFTNTTPDPLRIQARVEGSEVIFSLYGTKPAWRVEVDKPVITNVTPSDTRLVEEEDPNMPWGKRVQTEAASDGFDVTIVRRVYEPGSADPRTLRLRSSYRPSRNVVAVGTKGRPAGASGTTVTPPQAPASAATPDLPAASSRSATPARAGTPGPSSGTPTPAATPTPWPTEPIPSGQP